MDYLLVGLITFALGWFLGTLLLRVKLRLALEQLLKDDLLIDAAHANTIPLLSTELVDGVIFLYDTATSTFLCQGTTIDDVAKKLNESCHVPFAQIKHNEHYLMVVDGMITSQD
jgi:hypothetical protein